MIFLRRDLEKIHANNEDTIVVLSSSDIEIFVLSMKLIII